MTLPFFTNLSWPQIAAIFLPILLIPFMAWAFQNLKQRYKHPLGYLLGFIIYWFGWCVIVPTILLGGIMPVVDLFVPVPALTSLPLITHLELWWPIIFPLVVVFIPRVRKASPAILAASLLLGIIIGLTEEILWRGLYLHLFPDSWWLGIFYPTVMFALWHLAPQSVVANRMPGGAFSFVAYAGLLGFSFALASQSTGSIGWAAISHIIHDSLGLGAFAYAAWLMPDLKRASPQAT